MKFCLLQWDYVPQYNYGLYCIFPKKNISFCSELTYVVILPYNSYGIVILLEQRFLKPYSVRKPTVDTTMSFSMAFKLHT